MYEAIRYSSFLVYCLNYLNRNKDIITLRQTQCHKLTAFALFGINSVSINANSLWYALKPHFPQVLCLTIAIVRKTLS